MWRRETASRQSEEEYGAAAIHPEATHHLPFFITPPGETDILMNVMIVFLALIVFLIGILYLRLHALPEHMAHRTQKVQYEIVAVLALISLFTHNHIYLDRRAAVGPGPASGLLDAADANG